MSLGMGSAVAGDARLPRIKERRHPGVEGHDQQARHQDQERGETTVSAEPLFATDKYRCAVPALRPEQVLRA